MATIKSSKSINIADKSSYEQFLVKNVWTRNKAEAEEVKHVQKIYNRLIKASYETDHAKSQLNNRQRGQTMSPNRTESMIIMKYPGINNNLCSYPLPSPSHELDIGANHDPLISKSKSLIKMGANPISIFL